MATFMIEEERGTCSGHRHPHNGYYAGDFGARADLTAARPRVVRVEQVRAG